MKLTISLSRDAYDRVAEFDAKQYRQIVQKILSLSIDPKPADASALKGFDYYRVDIGEYRIVYRFDDNNVHIILVGKRNDDEVYKKLKRKE